MNVIETELPGLVLVEPKVFGDARGFFLETYQEQRYAELKIGPRFVQDNLSRSRRGTLRGLHFQCEHPQGKLVQVLRGEVFDVAVDLRRSSPTFGRSYGVILNEDNRRQLFIPPGFAHGFCVLSETADFFYKCTDFYFPQFERTLLWNDPALAINWPDLGGPPLLSAKDEKGLPLSQIEPFP